MSTRVPLLFGTMTMGEAGKNGVRNSDLGECAEILATFARHGHKEIDTARMYGGGTTEKHLAQLDLGDSTVDTNVPFEETLEEMNKLHKEGYYEILGLSNFASWEVAEVASICKAKGYIQPKIYQAMYNAITRAIEPELVPCCRKLGIRIVIYNPLAGGLFAGKLSSPADAPTEGRFNSTTPSGKLYRDRYLKEGNFDALNHVKDVAAQHGLRLTEIALRWCQHHSVLGPEDGVILGASSTDQLHQNCEDSAKGPLPDAIVTALNEAWEISRGTSSTYWR